METEKHNETVNLLKEVPVIKNRTQLQSYLKPLYIIADYQSDYDTYSDFCTRIDNLIKGCFVVKKCRDFKIKFKFYPKDKETHELNIRNFYTNIVLWTPFVELNTVEVLDKSFILEGESIPTLEDYINEKLLPTLRDYYIKSTKINYAVSQVLYRLRQVSLDFSLIMGLNFSAPMFVEAYNANTELRDMMECHFDSGLQPDVIEGKLDAYQQRVIEIFKEMGNHLGIVLKAGTGMKYKQLTEFTISEGLKPTVEGVTIPIPIENSTLLRGLDRPSYYYIDALGARKSFFALKNVA